MKVGQRVTVIQTCDDPHFQDEDAKLIGQKGTIVEVDEENTTVEVDLDCGNGGPHLLFFYQVEAN